MERGAQLTGEETKGGSLPLYLRITEMISREISSGIWPDGSRLPTEADLSKQLGVAIGTLRKALAMLESRGLLERIQGSGTYVRRKAKSGSIYEFLHLELKTGGGLPTARILSLDRCPKPEFLPRFGDGSSAQAWRVRRMRHLGGVTAALEEIWFDGRHATDLSADNIAESMHLFYREQLGFWIARVEDKVSVAPCPNFAPEGGHFSKGEPLGYVERVSWGNSGEIEEFSRNWFDPETVCYAARWV
jgi:GntR family transcriptional regulator